MPGPRACNHGGIGPDHRAECERWQNSCNAITSLLSGAKLIYEQIQETAGQFGFDRIPSCVHGHTFQQHPDYEH